MEHTTLFGIPRKKQEVLSTDVWHNFCNFILTGEISLLHFELWDFLFVSIKRCFMNWRRQSKKILLLSSLSFWQSLGLCAALQNQLCNSVRVWLLSQAGFFSIHFGLGNSLIASKSKFALVHWDFPAVSNGGKPLWWKSTELRSALKFAAGKFSARSWVSPLPKWIL